MMGAVSLIPSAFGGMILVRTRLAAFGAPLDFVDWLIYWPGLRRVLSELIASGKESRNAVAELPNVDVKTLRRALAGERRS